MRVIARWLVVSLSLLCLPLAAQPLSGLYQVREPVASQQPEERDAALKRALDTLVLRLTGDPQALQNPAVVALRSDPQQIISRYAYENATPQALLVEFDPSSAERSMRQAGLALWSANRPAILAWWLNETSESSALVGDAQPAASVLRNAAVRSGLPLRLPLADLDEQLLATAENLAAPQPAALLPASARYNADALLAVQAREVDGQWQAQWQLWLGESREQGSAQGADQQAVADAVLQAVSARLAPRFVSQPGAAQALQIQVQGANLARYAQLQGLLAPFAGRLQRADGEQLLFSVQASPEQLRAQLALAQLQEGPSAALDAESAAPVPAPVNPNVLQFHW
ncbi:MAG: DUF2066 domain-containing protein [Pseudomonadaceae bacterium]|jgi:hypothetical protein|nr:DUF2066 domain-containing protein [Pseudomonadaceae bacterium]